ncbi:MULTISPECIES: type II toxin-antitoxin system ParD family antitoxin [unclassified Chamaesiphon]|uniref:ribbon-helix-helix domain-containing protein n=1 Tax=unclassified Chamaesiphon TaxID=2620921 RepID=UPI00286C463E|nr:MULTISPECIES: type II toxin-antitoxin system ParD family antitoxin [unclassified Chamaesiphon]
MAIVLTPEHERFIQSQIDAGKFSNPEEVIDTAFRLLEKQNTEYFQWVNEVREKIDIARAEVARGEVLDGETVVNDILNRFRQARAARS